MRFWMKQIYGMIIYDNKVRHPTLIRWNKFAPGTVMQFGDMWFENIMITDNIRVTEWDYGRDSQKAL